VSLSKEHPDLGTKRLQEEGFLSQLPSVSLLLLVNVKLGQSHSLELCQFYFIIFFLLVTPALEITWGVDPRLLDPTRRGCYMLLCRWGWGLAGLEGRINQLCGLCELWRGSLNALLDVRVLKKTNTYFYLSDFGTQLQVGIDVQNDKFKIMRLTILLAPSWM